MSDLLRQYETNECGEDGYPYAWHKPSPMVWTAGGWLLTPGMDSSAEMPPIKDLIREQAGHRCQRCSHPYRVGEQGNGEWSRCDEQCTHGGPARCKPAGEGEWIYDFGEFSLPPAVPGVDTHLEAQWRILTVHHLDEDKTNCRWWNLVALDQRCHLRMQRAVVMDRPWHYQHSEWFRPYAAGFYGFKYLGEDLTRKETIERLDELLRLEHYWTQEALL